MIESDVTRGSENAAECVLDAINDVLNTIYLLNESARFLNNTYSIDGNFENFKVSHRWIYSSFFLSRSHSHAPFLSFPIHSLPLSLPLSGP